MKLLWMTPDAETVRAVSPDSCQVIRANPFFIPDTAPWQATLHLGVVIDRLGMKVAYKWADRYYNSVSLIAHTRHADSATECEYTRDGAALRGVDIPMSDTDLRITDADGAIVTTLEAASIRDLARKAIVTTSKLHTIKTGDVACLPLDVRPLDLDMGLTRRLLVNDTNALTIKIR